MASKGRVPGLRRGLRRGFLFLTPDRLAVRNPVKRVKLESANLGKFLTDVNLTF